MQQEIHDYVDVLLGRTQPPIDRGVLTLMECAEAYFARACEIEMKIQQMEAEGAVLKGSAQYKFRVGTLRTFQELCKRAIDLGSRRVTYAQLEANGGR